MNKFVSTINTPVETRTTNGMKTLNQSGNALTDFFFQAGASRGKDITPLFVSAFQEDKLLATKLLFWLGDVRGGAGERENFRNCVKWLADNHPEIVRENIDLIPFFNRWDSGFVIEQPKVRKTFLEFMATAIRNGDGLACKWADRKGKNAVDLRNTMGLSPKRYRKMIVNGSNTVEQLMCAKQFDAIEFQKVPSVASARYQKAFGRNAQEKYAKYIESLQKGETKINASAIFPHEVIHALRHGNRAVAIEQWKALPNYMNDERVLAVVDVSGSMDVPVNRKLGYGTPTAMDVALALGLYAADKLTGAFKDTFLTFSGSPELLHLRGNLGEKLDQMEKSKWATNTDLNAAMECVLRHAVRNSVPNEDMPTTLVILSDMQFNQCVRHDDSAMKMIQRKFTDAGYTVPKVVFWNIMSQDKQTPVSFDKSGTALVSGFSPAIFKSILSAEEMTPMSIMLSTINSERYEKVVV